MLAVCEEKKKDEAINMKAYQLKISLKDIKPPIWRRIIVPAGLSFAQFTLIVNSVFEWEGYHLSDYYFGKVCEVVTNDTENNDFSLSFMDEPTVLDSATTIIDDYFDMKMDAVYTYDFGDNWEHKIHVEEILDDYDKNYAQVIKFKGDAPIEDCGGVWGFNDNPELNSEPFDMESTNKLLEQLKLSKRKAKAKNYMQLMDDFAVNTSFEFKTVKAEEKQSNVNIQFDDLSELMNMPIYAEIIDKILRNTQMTKEEIMDAMELTESQRLFYEVVKKNPDGFLK